MAKFWQSSAPASVDLTKQWKDSIRATPIGRQFKSVAIAAFSITGLTWRDGSIISHEFPVTLDNPFSIRLPITTPSNPNFCLAVRFGSPVQRYKLWEGVGEILNVPLYAGEVIEASAVFEIWTVASSTTTSSVAGVGLDLSLTFLRTGCDDASLAAQIAAELTTPTGANPPSVGMGVYTSPAPLPLTFV